jgi:NMD protein affecting ribosome stability and mRNA decay
MSSRRSQRYSLSYKERAAAQQDPYAMGRAPKEPVVCPTCHAIYMKKRWFIDLPEAARIEGLPTTQHVLCPACRKIRDQYPEGILTLKWSELRAHEADLRGLIKNVEARAMSVNPLERVMKIRRRADAMEIQTTNDKLVQRLGREIVRAFHGKVIYHWPHQDKLTRVEWHGPVKSKKKEPSKQRSRRAPR